MLVCILPNIAHHAGRLTIKLGSRGGVAGKAADLENNVGETKGNIITYIIGMGNYSIIVIIVIILLAIIDIVYFSLTSDTLIYKYIYLLLHD